MGLGLNHPCILTSPGQGPGFESEEVLWLLNKLLNVYLQTSGVFGMQNEILKMNICNSNTRYLWTCWLKMQFCARTSEKVIHPKGASCSFFSLPLIERFSQSCIYWLALCLQIHGNSASVNWSRCFQAVIFLPVSPQMPSLHRQEHHPGRHVFHQAPSLNSAWSLTT